MKMNAVYAVTFLDHVEDSFEPLVCEVIGRLVQITDDWITLQCWTTQGDTSRHNAKTFTILRSTIESLDRMDYKR